MAVNIIQPCNIYGTTIPEDVFVGPFVEIQKNCTIGSKTRISSHSFICENVHIGKNCFIGHGVVFTNDKFKQNNANVRPKEYLKTVIGDNVQIGSNATILPVEICKNAIIGAGSVVTHNVEEGGVVIGNPAKSLLSQENTKLDSQKSLIRLTDVRKVNKEFESDYGCVLERVLKSGKYSLGKETHLLEQNLQKLLGVNFVLGVNSGTAALKLAFEELNLTDQDEFIVQSNTFIASLLTLVSKKCTIIITDVNNDGSINIDNVEKLISNRTRGIMVVHLYGDVVADMFRLRKLCDDRDLILIEDCAQALGSKLDDRMIGSFGDISCFSFYPTKNIGAIGEGGAIATNRIDFYENIRKRRNLGCSLTNRYDYELLGDNARMDELQAGFLNCKLPYLEQFIRKKRILASMYEQKLADSALVSRFISRITNVYHSCHLMVYLVHKSYRDKLIKFLNDSNIEALIHYPIPFYKSKAMNHLFSKNEDGTSKIRGNVEMSDFLAKNIISLPMYHTMSTEDVVYICDKILQFEKTTSSL
jgi:dTDP-4-amino-4,6-dideoxygalactose transaminase/acetyltransferase-like isoleucine patch superfamily enzyme